MDGPLAVVGAVRDDLQAQDAGSVYVLTADEIDCNGNGIADACDIAGGASLDLNGNGRPDECDPDCNGNGTPDFVEVLEGLAGDCDGDGLLDDCAIAAGVSVDCNGNGIPDTCETDCNGNGIDDSCDVAQGRSADINRNGIPDECEDCNHNGVLDEQDVTSGTSEDCNGNGLPDSCEITDYQLDDGTAENGVGLYDPGDLIWLNHFVVEPDAEVVSSISIAWSEFVAEGQAATVMLYGDPDDDGNPDNAVLLVTAETTTAAPGTNQLIRVPIPPTVVGEAGDSFFVGAKFTDFFEEYPAAIDTSSPAAEQSWIAWSSPFQADLKRLYNNDSYVIPVDYLCCPGNWLLRADATHPGGVPAECHLSRRYRSLGRRRRRGPGRGDHELGDLRSALHRRSQQRPRGRRAGPGSGHPELGRMLGRPLAPRERVASEAKRAG